MSKKSFAKGIDSILGQEENEENASSISKKIESFTEPQDDLIHVRTTIFINEPLYEKIKAIAYWERRTLKSLVDEALSSYVQAKGSKYVNDVTKKYLESQQRGN
ncbi:MAG: hypothetical protein ACHQUC_02825 [Chlamydiales bacterium]